MNLIRWLTAFCAAIVLVSCVNPSRDVENALRGHVAVGKPIPESAFQPVMEGNHVPAVSVAVIRGGEIDWARGYGICEAGSADRVNEETLFQAASISKPVTAAAALRMVEAGQLSLDEDANRKLRSWKVPENAFTAEHPVTLRELLSHSAGLTVHGFPGYTAGEDLPTLVQILNGEKPANTQPVRVNIEPGKSFRYSGGGYLVAQQLMVDVAAQPFPDLMQRLVLQPVGMTSSAYDQPLMETRRSRAATGHRSNGEPVRGRWHIYPELAAAGLWTTPTDLARFAIEVRRSYYGEPGPLLSQDMAKKMLTRQVGGYGLGFGIPAKGVPRFQHGGANLGFKCFLVLSVESGDGVVIMTNGESGGALINVIFPAIAAAYGWHV